MHIATLAAASNRASLKRYFEAWDDDANEGLDLSNLDILLTIADPVSGAARLTVMIGDGVTIIEAGVFEVFFSRDDMADLEAGSYPVGCTISEGPDADDESEQFLVGILPIVDGVVEA
jgi:hypothetical protein